MRSNERIRILHLSDVHFSPNIDEDVDKKVALRLNTKSEKTDKLIEYISALDKKPDYVVVSGDITTCGEVDGFKKFDDFVIKLIERDKLPPIDKFIITPGNHDVGIGIDLDDKNRWDQFYKYIGYKYLIPWIVSVAPSYEVMTSATISALDSEQSVIGGSIEQKNTRERISLPFLLDMDNHVLFYSFNSALLSQTQIADNVAREMINHVKSNFEQRSDSYQIAVKLENELKVDPARIIGDELKLFAFCIDQIKKKLGDSYKDFLKVAVLHHHISPIACTEEIKKFEILINSGVFKRTLAEADFDIVLHGHKHWPEVFYDSAISGGGSLLVVSGGTIFGAASKRKNAGFYILDFDLDSKMMYPAFLEITDSYSPLLSDKKIIACSYRNLHRRIFSEEVSVDLQQVQKNVNIAIVKHLISEDSDNQIRHGWSRIITSQKIGMMGTCYGLLLGQILSNSLPLYIESKTNIIETLWDFRLPMGGFSAVSQTENPALEATSLALRTYIMFGAEDKARCILSDLLDLLEKQPINDDTSVTTISLVVSALCVADPRNKLLNEFFVILLRKAYCVDGVIKYWPVVNPQMIKDSESYTDGSVVYTALAISTLMELIETNTSDNIMVDLKPAGEWLLMSSSDDWEEIISKPLTKYKEDRLVFQHFTAAHKLLALTMLGYNKSESGVRNLVSSILSRYSNGLFYWRNKDNFPIWAVYYAMIALRRYAMSAIET